MQFLYFIEGAVAVDEAKLDELGLLKIIGRPYAQGQIDRGRPASRAC